MEKLWRLIENADEIPSPALLVYPDRIQENIQRAIAIAGGPDRLRPHIKTHKIPQIIELHKRAGVNKFKCATLAEARILGECGAADVLVAYPPTGPLMKVLQDLRNSSPQTRYSVLCDSPASLQLLQPFLNPNQRLPVFIDLDCGMGRTGIPPGPAALDLALRICRDPGLEFAGLHVYDGHIHEPDPRKRMEECDAAWQPVTTFFSELKAQGVAIPEIVAGGTPTFPVHAAHPERTCSPGTYVFWDFGYQKFSDLPFLIAALLLARVVSKPAPNRLCVDLGYKAVASENPQPRVQFIELPDAKVVMHSEEHLVIETAQAEKWNIGDVLYGVPRHICPTVALYDEAWVVENGKAGATWTVTARKRLCQSGEHRLASGKS